jgi:hypothetical protein
MGALTTYRRLPFSSKIMAVEAALLLAAARALILFVPFRYWRGWLGTVQGAPADGAHPPVPVRDGRAAAQDLPARDGSGRDGSGRNGSACRPTGIEVGRMVRVTAKRLPFKAVCLPQALAARWMLRRRGIEAQIVIGARKGNDGKTVDLHAWTIADGAVVTGAGELPSFRPLAQFGGIDSR